MPLSRPRPRQRAGDKPTIVLVHGAFADASGVGAVTSRLQRRGYTVIAPANPLRGPSSDAAYVASVMRTISGPIVLVGHSYGGAVISEAATQVPNVKALVYLDALALEAGESNLDIANRFPSKLLPALQPRPFPQADGSEGTDLYIDPAQFRAVFAADLPAPITARMAAAQRPISLAAGQEKSTEPAWKTIPSWYLVGRQDEVFPAAAQRFMAKRAGAHITEIDSSHASYISHPAKVTKLILRAARTVREPCLLRSRRSSARARSYAGSSRPGVPRPGALPRHLQGSRGTVQMTGPRQGRCPE